MIRIANRRLSSLSLLAAVAVACGAPDGSFDDNAETSEQNVHIYKVTY
jgi:hypothetical protein